MSLPPVPTPSQEENVTPEALEARAQAILATFDAEEALAKDPWYAVPSLLQRLRLDRVAWLAYPVWWCARGIQLAWEEWERRRWGPIEPPEPPQPPAFRRARLTKVANASSDPASFESSPPSEKTAPPPPSSSKGTS